MSDTTYSSVLKKILEETGISSQLEKSSAVKKLREEVDEIKENLSEVLPLKELQETIRKNSGGISKSAPKGATVNTSLPIGKTKSEKQSETNNLTKSLGIKYAGLGTNGGLGISGTYDKTAVDNSSGTSTDVGAKIKSSLSEALKPKYGDIGIKGIFEKIGDRDVVKYLNQARDSIKRNVKNGILTEEKLADYPNMENGLAMFYAADEQGDKKAAKMAYEAAYTPTETKQLSMLTEENDGNEANDFYADYLKRKNSRQKDAFGRTRRSVKDVVREVAGNAYVDLTADGSGLDVSADPTPLEAAEMVKYVTDVMAPGKKINIKEVENAVGDWKWTGLYGKNHEGLDMGVFQKEANGQTTYVIVNAGSNFSVNGIANISETIDDWSNNFKQPIGASVDMVYSIGVAKKFVEDHPDANIIFVGYSKGGAEAAANAVATGKKAILFNPAKVNLGAYGLDAEEYDGEMISYVVDGEVLDEILGWVNSVDAENKVILEDTRKKEENSGSWFSNILSNISGSIEKHYIETVIELLKE